jgi:hypothetical protein
MISRQAWRSVSDRAESVIQFAANATNSIPHSKILLLAAFAALPVIVTVPILFRIDTPSVAADSTLKCYDSAGNHVPCLTQANAAPARVIDRTNSTLRPPAWTTTALYQEANWATTSAVDQPADSTSAPLTSAPVARHGNKFGKRLGLSACGRRLIPCVFSTLRRGLTHIASVAASMGRARRL